MTLDELTQKAMNACKSLKDSFSDTLGYVSSISQVSEDRILCWQWKTAYTEGGSCWNKASNHTNEDPQIDTLEVLLNGYSDEVKQQARNIVKHESYSYAADYYNDDYVAIRIISLQQLLEIINKTSAI